MDDLEKYPVSLIRLTLGGLSFSSIEVVVVMTHHLKTRFCRKPPLELIYLMNCKGKTLSRLMFSFKKEYPIDKGN